MNLDIRENVPLAEFTTLKIGGRARFFVSAKSEAEIIEAVHFAQRKNLQTFILGGGSNVLIADAGFDGLVLHIATKGISVAPQNDEIVFVTAQAGEDWDNYVAFCVEENLQGVECLSGIPGLIGGTPVQNVGAYGQEVSETISAVRCLDRKTGKIIELTNDDCLFAYRASVFNTTEKNRFVVLAVTFALRFGGAPKIVYRDLLNFFGGRKPDLSETRSAVLKIRAEKSMVIDAGDPNSRSAGSFFKNPVITKEHFAGVRERAGKQGIESVPFFTAGENHLKIPAAWLIEQGGFRKGFNFGRVGLSSNHTLAIVNQGDATAADVLALKENIQAKVKEKFDIDLLPEPIFVGNF